jgi:membrane-associated phospholipid phosphatase
MKDPLALKKIAMLFGNLALHIVGYLSINAYLAGQGRSYDIAIGLDHQIPFIKYFAPFYSIVYFIPITAFFLIWKNYDAVKAAAKAYAGAGIFCFTFFLTFPVKYNLRVEVLPPYDFFTNVLRFYYYVDEPYNCFPSLHVALATISTVIIHRYRPALTPVFLVLSTIVSLSILFMKQHYVLDLVGGLGVCLLMTVMFLPKPKAEKAAMLKPAVETDSI